METWKSPSITTNIAKTNEANTFTEVNTFNNSVVILNDPANDTDATNKRYVDTLFARRVQNSTINAASQLQYSAQAGYEIINVMVGRKRNDGYIFFQYDTSLKYQLFMHPNGKWTVYNSGTLNGFTNEFQITILEKKA